MLVQALHKPRGYQAAQPPAVKTKYLVPGH
jgi:hypothetical protein